MLLSFQTEGTHFEASRAAVKWDRHLPGSSSACLPYSNRDEFSSQPGTWVMRCHSWILGSLL